ncbi:MAG: BMP family lipoprotein [Candidatus Rifleibacteriota bacterium]
MQIKSTFFTQSVFRIGILSAITVLFLLLVGCGESQNGDSTADKVKIGLMITPKGLNDKGFNDYAFDGLKKAEEMYSVSGTVIEPSNMQNHEASLRFFAGQKFDAIIAVGVAFVDTIRKIAAEHPELDFYIIDSDINEGNIRGVSFREDEGAYLCGYLAARMSKSKKVGFLAGVDIPVIRRFLVGYVNGAKAASKSIEVVSRFVSDDFSGFNDSTKASKIALEMYQNGCDVIFPPAGASALGVISAAVKTRNFVIGVDMNQDALAPGLVLTSMVKRVDLVVEDLARSISKNEPPEKIKTTYGLADDALGLTDFQLSFKVIGEEIINELGKIRKKIIDDVVDTDKAIEENE